MKSLLFVTVMALSVNAYGEPFPPYPSDSDNLYSTDAEKYEYMTLTCMEESNDPEESPSIICYSANVAITPPVMGDALSKLLSLNQEQLGVLISNMDTSYCKTQKREMTKKSSSIHPDLKKSFADGEAFCLNPTVETFTNYMKTVLSVAAKTCTASTIPSMPLTYTYQKNINAWLYEYDTPPNHPCKFHETHVLYELHDSDSNHWVYEKSVEPKENGKQGCNLLLQEKKRFISAPVFTKPMNCQFINSQ